jgi:hypothetical protein
MLFDYRWHIKLPSWNCHTTPPLLSIRLPIILFLYIFLRNEHFLTSLFKFNLLLVPGMLVHTASPTQDQEILQIVQLAAATTTMQGRVIK